MTARVRGYVLDMSTNEGQSFAQNPQEFEEVYAAVYEDRAALAAPHHHGQFKATENVPVTMDVTYNRKIIAMLAMQAGNFQVTENQLDKVMNRAKAFFESLTSPRQHQGSILVQSPPTVLLMWPHVLRIRAKLIRCSIRNREFAITGHLVEFVASMEFKEIRDRDLYSTDIRRLGSMRGGGGG